ncbi:3-oxoadipate CoA-transferase subunit A [Achromobacter denitrificans]|jgi:3-oxoadipate CoA-transferase alpha subunit|uniref:3-oxoacid CoA-transferase subunit A n=1 Tax=Achromobacter denitrificans TaxID=32002 RepID=UPI001662CF8C|nr:3-oxoacid CoA-transferase subunit A [Achromobacter denitrificans]GFN29645.1 3-oxoadipate CoA-transferase subunit A [Achromobacter denitrificans]
MKDKTCLDAGDALRDVESGAAIFVGGFGGSGIPARLLAALLAKPGVRDLTLINNNAGAGETSFLALVAAGRVSRIVCSYPRMPGNEVIRDCVRAGSLVVEVMPQGTLVERIRAGGAGMGPFFSPTGYGTPLAEGKETRVYGGRGYVLETPLRADFAFVRAHRADRLGNLVYRRAQRNFGPVMCTAARTTIAEVDEILPCGALDPDHIVTPSLFVHRLLGSPQCKD